VTIDDNPGALWRRSWIEDFRVSDNPVLDRIVVGVDPAVTNNPDSDETGIVVVGISKEGEPDKITGRKVSHFYVLGDYSIKRTTNQWATAAVSAYHKHKADKMIGEGNQGVTSSNQISEILINIFFTKKFMHVRESQPEPNQSARYVNRGASITWVITKSWRIKCVNGTHKAATHRTASMH